MFDPILEDAEPGLVPKRKRGRPRKQGLYEANLDDALAGRLSERLQRLARVLVALDVARGGTLTRTCEYCGEPLRYTEDGESLEKIRTYCSKCGRSSSISTGVFFEDSDEMPVCPTCGAEGTLDRRLGEYFCNSEGCPDRWTVLGLQVAPPSEWAE